MLPYRDGPYPNWTVGEPWCCEVRFGGVALVGGRGRTDFRATLAAMSGQTDDPLFPPAPEPPTDLQPRRAPVKKRQRTTSEAALPWLLGVVIVLLLAASGGLVTAWIVAGMKAVPPPVAAGPTPTLRPAPTIAPTPTGLQTVAPTEQPLRTPTTAPQVTPEPEPFVHVVQRDEYLQYIADLYEVSVEDIVALNDITNPNKIRVGEELLIPGDGIRPSPTP